MKTRCLLVSVFVMIIVVTLANSSYAKIDQESILGIWLFDEISGGNKVKDSSQNDKVGTINGNPKLVEGNFKKALEFDGASDFVDVPINLNECEEVTVVIWTYTYKQPPGERYQMISNDKGSYGRCIQIRPTDYWIFHTEGQAITHAVVPTLNSWEHLAVTWSTEEVNFYINGELVATGTGDTAVYNDGTTVNIGRNMSQKDYYDGILDEVGFFNAVLAEDDIKNIADNGLEKALGIAAVSLNGKLPTVWAMIKAE